MDVRTTHRTMAQENTVFLSMVFLSESGWFCFPVFSAREIFQCRRKTDRILMKKMIQNPAPIFRLIPPLRELFLKKIHAKQKNKPV